MRCLALLAVVVGTSSASGTSRAAKALHVEVTVREDAGIARSAEIVTAGVPLPQAAGVRDVRTLRLLDETGGEVPLQARVLSRWGAPASDGKAPIRWVLADFPASIPGRGSRRFTLQTGAAARDAAAPLARKERGAVVVEADGHSLSFTTKAPGPMRLVASAPDGGAPVEGIAREIEIEENGPLRASIKVTGDLAGGFEEKGGRHPLRWILRWHVEKGSPLVRVVATIENPDRPHEKPFNDAGDPVGKRFGRLALELREPPPGAAASSAESSEGGGRLRVVQEGSGYVATRGKKQVGEGPRAAGWISAGGMSLGMRAFAENHPKALVAGDGVLALELFPADADPQIFGGARAKTHDVWLRYPGGIDSPREAAAAAMRPLRATVAPAWLQQTGALGALSVEDTRRFAAFEGTLDRIVAGDGVPADGTLFDERRAVGATGWRDYGDSPRDADPGARRFGNAEFDFGWVLLRQYLREPEHDAVWLEQAEAVLRHVMDVDVLHTDDDARWANHGVRKHDGGKFTEHGRGPDFSHFWVRGMLAYHLVTGDERAREVAVGEVGRWIENREEPSRSGTLIWADELRDVGWVLVALADLHDVTGDPKWLSLSKRVVHAMVLPGVDAEGTMRDAAFLNRRDGMMPWQQAYVADGLGRYALARRASGDADEKAEAALARMLDFLAGPAWIEEKTTIHGREYPRTLAFHLTRDGKKTATEASMSQAIADPMVWGWLLFGEERYRQAAIEAIRFTFPRGPETYFHPSIRTPAKNAAIRTYFGEGARWMLQTSPPPLAAAR